MSFLPNVLAIYFLYLIKQYRSVISTVSLILLLLYIYKCLFFKLKYFLFFDMSILDFNRKIMYYIDFYFYLF